MKRQTIIASAVLALALSPLATREALAQTVTQTTTSPVKVEVGISTVTVRGITPHGTVVIFAVIQQPQKHWTGYIRREFVLTDADGDGIVQATKLSIPGKSVWFAADIASGLSTVSGGRDETLRLMDLPGKGLARNLTGQSDHISVARGFVEGLVVRPGTGAWGFTAGDGGQHDVDGIVNGRVEVDPRQMWAIGNAPAAPDHLVAHDTLVIIDPNTMQLFASEVQP